MDPPFRIICVCVWCVGAVGLSSEVQQHLELGRKLLQEGKLSESLLHYDQAVGEKL